MSLDVNMFIFDVYEGEQLEPGKKCISLALVMRDTDKTLTSEEADMIAGRVAEHLQKVLNIKLRG